MHRDINFSEEDAAGKVCPLQSVTSREAPGVPCSLVTHAHLAHPTLPYLCGPLHTPFLCAG